MNFLSKFLSERRSRQFLQKSGALDEAYYKLQLKDRGIEIDISIAAHYLADGHKLGIKPHRLFDDEEYFNHHPDVEKSGLNALVHFLKYGAGERRHFSDHFHVGGYLEKHPDFDPENENILSHYNRLYSHNTNEAELFVGSKSLLDYATDLGYFDYQWYTKKYERIFSDSTEAFAHYCRVSRFSPISPSPKFDSSAYFKNNMDVYNLNLSPLLHYLNYGLYEGRPSTPNTQASLPNFLQFSESISAEAQSLKIAVCLHIFYQDYVELFAQALENFPVTIDILATVTTEEIKAACESSFKSIKIVSSFNIRVVENRGRNFGPMLVEFGDIIQNYDLLCHLHSKKSLYSGREQTQWSRYLIEYLINDPFVTSRALNAFAADKDIGLYYPATFWLMPGWVNHVLKNDGSMSYWSKKISSSQRSGFMAYPVGGMFWCRPKAIQQLLEAEHHYEDFPREPLENDGTILHGLERVIGSLTEDNGYKHLVYYPQYGKFSYSKAYMFQYYAADVSDWKKKALAFDTVSFDLLDTLLWRRYAFPDYAKLKLGKKLAQQGLVTSAEAFVCLRNETETSLRGQTLNGGDITLADVYRKLARLLKLDERQAYALKQLEFEFDLDMFYPKNEIVDLCNKLINLDHKVWIIADTYYGEIEIRSILHKIGVRGYHRLFTSSLMDLRKDNGSMWPYIKEQLAAAGSTSYIHIGSNVVADAQHPGDIGLHSLHILNPFDKWRALGFPAEFDERERNEEVILRNGESIARIGEFPWLL